MEQDLQKEIEKRIEALPPALQKSILQNDSESHVRDIGASHKLHIDQIGQLQDMVLMCMLGFIPPESFTNEVKQQLSIADEQVTPLVAELNKEIFLPIREMMKNTESAASANPSVPKASTPTPTHPTPPVSNAGTTHPADAVLSGKTSQITPPATTVTTPNTQAPQQPQTAQQKPLQPQPYKADPYREAI